MFALWHHCHGGWYKKANFFPSLKRVLAKMKRTKRKGNNDVHGTRGKLHADTAQK